MSTSVQVLAAAQDVLAVVEDGSEGATTGSGVRDGFQTLFGAFVVCLALYAVFHVNKVGHLIMAVVAAVVGAAIAFGTEAQWEAIGSGAMGVLTWAFGLF